MPVNAVECRRLLVNDPTSLPALQSLAIHMRNAGDGMQALRLFRRAYALHRDRQVFNQQIDATLHVALNQISALLDPGYFDLAAAQLEWLASFIPASGHLARMLALVLLVQGREGEAIAMRPHAGTTIPDDSGLAVALSALDTHRKQYGVIGTVVIPAFKTADTIVESLDSILATLTHYRSASGREDAQVHIVVVDDASPDNTVDVVRRWGQAHPDQGLALIVNNQNRGAGRARNAGVAAALGPYLWFLDADDRFLDQHFHITASTLDANPGCDYVRTDMLFDRIDAQVSPAWREASIHTYPCNLCIRREAHARTGGFPEETPFWPATADDVAYSRAIMLMLKGVKIGVKTVFYRMRPGNVLDRMQAEMTSDRPPGEGAEVDARFMAIEILIRRRLYALSAGREATERNLTGNATPLITLAQEKTGVGDHAAAHALLRRATGLAPTNALSWFELGMASHRLSRGNEAKTAFTRAAGLRPDMAAARINLGLLLAEEGDAVTALPHLCRAVELAPSNANARFLLGRVQRRLGQSADAQANLQQAITLAPTVAEYHAEWSGMLLDGGDAVAALAAADHAARLSPALYDAHSARAAALEALHRLGEALAAWDQAIACNQGIGEAFTRRALLLLSAQWGAPPTPRAQAQNDSRRLGLSQLGRNGRFGNQILQYGIARLYAQRHDLILETPPWVGRHLFDLDDPLPGPALPRLSEAAAGLVTGLGPESPPTAAGHDIDGYFCGDTSALAPFAESFRNFFTCGDHWCQRVAQVSDRLRDAGDTIVALHLRRGDFGWGPFWVAPEAWYLNWLAEIWPQLARPVLYIATDDPTSLAAFNRYQPLTAANLSIDPIKGLDFLEDFQALCLADILAISNSTFSFTAGLLNRRARSFHRPDRAIGALVPYAPWSSPALLS